MTIDFTFNDIPDLTGKIAIVTGGATGIGKIYVQKLAEKNCKVVIACRPQDMNEDFSVLNFKVPPEYLELDLADISNIRRFVDKFCFKYNALHILINNAGVLLAPHQLTVDGYELHFAVNYLGHLILTLALEDILARSAPSRVVVTSSIAHEWLKKNYKRVNSIDKLNTSNEYHPLQAYAQSKAACVACVVVLSSRFQNKGILINAIHPGFVKSGLHRVYPSWYIKIMFEIVIQLTGMKTEDGARTGLFAATSSVITKGGELYYPYTKKTLPTGVTEKFILELVILTNQILQRHNIPSKL